jgi:hypothetical protein
MARRTPTKALLVAKQLAHECRASLVVLHVVQRYATETGLAKYADEEQVKTKLEQQAEQLSDTDSEYGVSLGDLLELLQWGALIDWKVGTPARGHLEVAPQDRSTKARIDLLENNLLGATMPQHRLASGCAYVAHPVCLLAEHRDEIPLAVVLRSDHGEREAPSRPTPAYLEPR